MAGIAGRIVRFPKKVLLTGQVLPAFFDNGDMKELPLYHTSCLSCMEALILL
jgi:hypothetical protein